MSFLRPRIEKWTDIGRELGRVQAWLEQHSAKLAKMLRFSLWTNYYDDSTLVGWAAGGMTNTLIYVMTLGPIVFVQYHINGPDDGATNTCSFTVPYPQRNIAGLAMRAVGHRDETVGGYDHNTIVLEPNEQQVHLHYSGAGDPAGWPVGGARNVWGQFWYLR